MESCNLHIVETAGWRALLTHAQIAGGVRISPAAEEYMLSMLFRQIGVEMLGVGPKTGLLDRLNQMLMADTVDPALIGDQCLWVAGLFPENAIRKGIPVAYFVQVGRNAYREYAARYGSDPMHYWVTSSSSRWTLCKPCVCCNRASPASTDSTLIICGGISEARTVGACCAS
ncbi:MAG: hypothetical protein AAEJ43_09320 [Gammaproteobacteria bacterium]